VRRRRPVLVALAALGLAPLSSPRDPGPPIAAAADLRFALPEIASLFEARSGDRVRLTFGSSGDLTRQIEQGAPFELLLSADEAYVARLASGGLTRDDGVLYAVGRLVLFAPHGSPVTVDEEARGLRAAVAAGAVTRFAIANPEHAPYGRAAREVLETLGVWEALKPRLILGENAAQAMQFAASGSSQGGIVPLSLSRAPEIAKLGAFARLPANWHGPLRQRMVLLRRAGPTATAFCAFAQSPAARAVFVRYGFELPGER
jgi:molybdate transport system substrate-binding protein